jgi:hypothetical protein
VLDDAVDDRESVEAGNGRYALADRAAGQAAVFHHASPKFEMAAASGEQLEVALGAPGEEVLEVGRVADPGGARVAGQEPSDGQSGIIE